MMKLHTELTLLAALASSASLASSLDAQAGSATAAGAPDRTIFEGATVIDGTGAPARPGMAIVVEGDVIAGIVPVRDLSADAREGAEIVDASGWFAIPGLVEAHTHLASVADRETAEFILNRQLFAGITTVRDMGGDARALIDLQRASLVKEIPAPDLHFSALMAGPGFFGNRRAALAAAGERTGAVPWLQAVTDETDFAEAVTLARGIWASGIKLYFPFEGELLGKVVPEASRQGIPVWSHVSIGPARPLEVARAGVRSMAHSCGIMQAAIPDDVYREGEEGKRSGVVEVDLNGPEVDTLFATMKRNGTVLDATLRVMVPREWLMVERDTAEARRPGEAENPDSAQPDPPPPPPIDFRPQGIVVNCGLEEAIEATRLAYEAGVMIAAGTDGTSEPDSVFPALHEEIGYLHEWAGMTMMDVLTAATHHGAVALGLEDTIGTLEPGKHANIVFLREDPLAGLGSLRSVELTVKRGTLYYRRDFVLGAPPRPGLPGEIR
ncbi:MAG: amidohydrolase family protein [Gemmatimonadetes bacterium]|nr:amidohydrolase family protein [Gemmatimonadota bacterium]